MSGCTKHTNALGIVFGHNLNGTTCFVGSSDTISATLRVDRISTSLQFVKAIKCFGHICTYFVTQHKEESACEFAQCLFMMAVTLNSSNQTNKDKFRARSSRTFCFLKICLFTVTILLHEQRRA